VRRAPNPWDRFYRYHEAPWRGERELEPLRPYFGLGRVLELGCGNGKLLRPLRNAGFDAVGLDVAFHAVRRVGGVLADAAVLPFGNSIFSAVMDIHCTGHLTGDGRTSAMAEAFRVLEPGGYLVVRRLGHEDLRATKGSVIAGDIGTRQLNDERTTHFTSQTELTTALQDAGFQVAAAETIVQNPRIRTERVRREHVQVVGQKPQE
jgi:SAM-dependent methyltransferase